jgi:ribosome biogenesis GTPase
VRARIHTAGRRGVILAIPGGGTVKASLSGAVYRDAGGAVCGDLVEAAPGVPRWRVTEVLPRKSVLTRTSPLGKPQVLAANVDRVLAVASICHPPLRRGFLDRVLASAEYNGLRCVVVLNKTDLSDLPEAADVRELASVYRDGAGYDVIPVSAETGAGIRELREMIRGQAVVLTGPSGAGKTSLALALNPGLDLAVGALNTRTSRGRHTTVASRLLHLGDDTWLMDTPGLRAFSVEHIPPDRLRFCFPEFRAPGPCRFRDCLHDSEPGCAVRRTVDSGGVARCRYESYLKLLGEVREAAPGRFQEGSAAE